MRILYLAMSPQAHQGAGGRTRIVSVARLAAAAGHEVQILCLVGARDRLRPGALRRARQQLEADSECPVQYVGRLPTFRVPLLRRWQRAAAVRAVARAARRAQAELLHGHGTSVSALALAARQRVAGVPVVADVHGVAAEEYRAAMAAAADDPRYLQLRTQEIAVIRDADATLFVSERMRRFYAEEYGVAPRSHAIIPSAANASPPGKDDRETARAELGLGDRTVIAYVGSHRPYQLPAQTAQLLAALHAARPDVHALVLTSHRDAFRAELVAAGMDAAAFTIRTVPQPEVARLLLAADLGLLLRADSPVNRVSSPTKLAEYLRSGVPVLTTRFVGDFSDVVEEQQLGAVIDLPATVAQVLPYLEHVAADRAGIARRCRGYAESALTWDQAGPRLMGVYEGLRERR